jgi:hypothetical protein
MKAGRKKSAARALVAPRFTGYAAAFSPQSWHFSG